MKRAAETFERDLAGYSLLSPEAEEYLNFKIHQIQPFEPFAREEMRWVQMIGVRMGLQAIWHLLQRTVVHMRSCHNVGAEINQLVFGNRLSRMCRKQE